MTMVNEEYERGGVHRYVGDGQMRMRSIFLDPIKVPLALGYN